MLFQHYKFKFFSCTKPFLIHKQVIKNLRRHLCKVINYYSQAEQKSEENTRTSSNSAADLSSIHLGFICTAKKKKYIIQIYYEIVLK